MKSDSKTPEKRKSEMIYLVKMRVDKKINDEKVYGSRMKAKSEKVK